MATRYTRRQFLIGTVSAAVTSLLISACQSEEQQPAPTAAPAVTPTQAAAASPTQPAAATATPAATPTVAPAASPTMAQRPDRTFRFAYLRLGWAGCEAIDDLGLLSARGWKLEWNRIDQISALANAFAAGQADIIDMSVVIAAQMHEQGVPLKIFSAAVGTLGSILVRPGLGVSSVPDLRGKRVGGIPGGTTTQDFNAVLRRLYDFDLLTDTEFIQASTPPDAVNLLINGNVDALLMWEPTVSRLTNSGQAEILVTQQELWKQVSGSDTPQVHVIYMTSPELAEEYPELMQDIIAAQEEVAELWRAGDDKAVQAFANVTELPPDVISTALSRTKPLAGLSKDLQDTILMQLKFNRESGVLLQSDLWLNAEEARAALFWEP